MSFNSSADHFVDDEQALPDTPSGRSAIGAAFLLATTLAGPAVAQGQERYDFDAGSDPAKVLVLDTAADGGSVCGDAETTQAVPIDPQTVPLPPDVFTVGPFSIFVLNKDHTQVHDFREMPGTEAETTGWQLVVDVNKSVQVEDVSIIAEWPGATGATGKMPFSNPDKGELRYRSDLALIYGKRLVFNVDGQPVGAVWVKLAELNAPCNAELVCLNGLQCDGGVCLPTVAPPIIASELPLLALKTQGAGEPCSDRKLCFDGLDCLGEEGFKVCVERDIESGEPIEPGVGTPCGPDQPCIDGLVCDENSHLCVEPSPLPRTGPEIVGDGDRCDNKEFVCRDGLECVENICLRSLPPPPPVERDFDELDPGAWRRYCPQPFGSAGVPFIHVSSGDGVALWPGFEAEAGCNFLERRKLGLAVEYAWRPIVASVEPEHGYRVVPGHAEVDGDAHSVIFEAVGRLPLGDHVHLVGGGGLGPTVWKFDGRKRALEALEVTDEGLPTRDISPHTATSLDVKFTGGVVVQIGYVRIKLAANGQLPVTHGADPATFFVDANIGLQK